MDLGLPQWERGVHSRQAHADLPAGVVEEEHGRDGFLGPASHLYRLHPPTAWTAVEGPTRHLALDTTALAVDGTWPTWLLVNAQVSIGAQVVTAAGDFLRDADGDLAYFVHAGSGRLRTEYGPLDYRPGDHLVVPRGTTFRFEPIDATHLLAVEATGGRLRLPDRGLLGRHALFDPAVVEVPDAEAVDVAGDFTVVVKRAGVDTRVRYPFHPCDVVGWKGDVAPLRLPVDAIRPVTSPRYHLPPSVHSTWVGDGFVIATFVPRPMETDPQALRLPFFHRNVDYDEVIFYHRGEFFSRAGIAPGTISFHPTGLHHGPQPEARRRDAEAATANGSPRIADEVAVMVDTRLPLTPTPAALDVEVPGYVESWAEPPVPVP